MLQTILKFSSRVRNALGSFLHRARFFAFAAVPAVLLFVPMEAHAGIVSVIGSVASGIIGAGGEAAATFMMWIVIIWSMVHIFYGMAMAIFIWLINFLIGVSQYNSFLGAPIVTIGWAVTRDIANMFLVVALLVIAFGVIFDSHHYQAQKMLKDFFIAAILVNFSKMICGLMLDAAQVVMMTFVSGFSDTAAGNFVKMFQVGSFLKLAAGNAGVIDKATVADLAAQSGDLFSTITNEIFSFILIFFGCVAVLSMLAVLVGRILTVWFLIIASPLAFVLNVLPMTAKYSSKWWHAFEQQLIAGPIVAFVIWVSLASIAVSENSFNLTEQAQQGKALYAETANSSQQAIAGTAISTWSNLALYFVPIVLFILGAQWAVKLSGGIAQSLNKMTAGVVDKYGRKGLGALGNQVYGSGAFSMKTQAKKGLTGEGMWAGMSSRVAQSAGEGLQKLGERRGGTLGVLADKTGRFIQKAQDETVGANRGAKTRSGYKDAKKAMTWAGIGKDADEINENKKVDADANLVEQRASSALIQAQKAQANLYQEADRAASMGEIDGAQRLEIRQQADQGVASAMAQMTVARKRAGEIRGTRSSDRQKKLKTMGMTEPSVIINDLQERVNRGEKISQSDIDDLKTLHAEGLKAERTRRIEEAEATGLITNQEDRAAFNRQITNEQRASSDMMASMVTSLGGTRLEADTAAQKKRQENFNRDTSRNAGVLATATQTKSAIATIRATGRTVGDMADPDVVTDIARTIGNQAINIRNGDGTSNQGRQREAISEALRHVPESIRGAVRNELGAMDFQRRDAQGNALNMPGTGPGTGVAGIPMPNEIFDVRVTARIDPAGVLGFDYDSNDPTYARDALAARAARGNTGPYPGKYNETDLRMVQNARGQFEFTDPKNARVLEGLVRTAPALIQEMNPEVLRNYDAQQAIGKAISTPDQLRQVRDALMADDNYSQQLVVDIMRGLKDAAVQYSESEPQRRALANAVVFDQPESAMSELLAVDLGPSGGNVI